MADASMALVPYKVGVASAAADVEERLVQLPQGICLRVQQHPRSSGAWRHLNPGARQAAATPELSQERQVHAWTQPQATTTTGRDGASPPPPPPPPPPDLSHVGLVVWQSSLVLADWLLRWPPCGTGSWPEVWALELGAGTGVVGMALALAGARVVLSDRPAITRLTRANVTANCGGAPRGAPPVVDHVWGEPVGALLRPLATGEPVPPVAAPCEAGAADGSAAHKAASPAELAAASDGAAAAQPPASTSAAAADAPAACAGGGLSTKGAPPLGYDLIVAADVLYSPEGHGPLLDTLCATAAPHALVALAHRLRGLGEEGFAAAAEARGWAVRRPPLEQLHEEFQGGQYEVLLLAWLG